MTQIEAAMPVTKTNSFILTINGCGGEHTMGTIKNEIAKYEDVQDQLNRFNDERQREYDNYIQGIINQNEEEIRESQLTVTELDRQGEDLIYKFNEFKL